MKVRRLKRYLEDLQDEGYGAYTLYLSDQDCDFYTVNEVFEDEDEDVCLQSTDGYEMSVDEILSELDNMDDDSYVYFENLYWDDSNLICDIEGGWYTDDDGDVVMDVCYHDDDDDDW